MNFSKSIGMKERTHQEIVERESVRCICLRDNKVLMVSSKKGEYIFPGGGIKKGENHEATLTREILEETGYICENIIEFAGKVFERKVDIYEPDKIFEMTSYYYLCKLSENRGEQQLEAYEEAIELRPVWICVEEAINCNRSFKKELKQDDLWLVRPNCVLEEVGK